MKTRTANLALGFRRGGRDWQKDLEGLIEWALANDLEAIDLGRDGDRSAKLVTEAGLRIGSVDLSDWQGMISPSITFTAKTQSC
jgi:hypothetical protein